jgi:hypothetical protein
MNGPRRNNLYTTRRPSFKIALQEREGGKRADSCYPFQMYLEARPTYKLFYKREKGRKRADSCYSFQMDWRPCGRATHADVMKGFNFILKTNVV